VNNFLDKDNRLKPLEIDEKDLDFFEESIFKSE